MFICTTCASAMGRQGLSLSRGLCEMCGEGPRACFDIPSALLPDATAPPEIRCDCSPCRPGQSFIGCGNPPHGWFRLARYNLATREDSYLWCCSWCHAVVFDENDRGWMYLLSHESACPGKVRNA